MNKDKKLNGPLRWMLIFYTAFYIYGVITSGLAVINKTHPTIIGYSKLEILIAYIPTIIIIISFILIIKCKKIGVLMFGIFGILSTIYGFTIADYENSILGLLFMFFLGYLLYKDRELFI